MYQRIAYLVSLWKSNYLSTRRFLPNLPFHVAFMVYPFFPGFSLYAVLYVLIFSCTPCTAQFVPAKVNRDLPRESGRVQFFTIARSPLGKIWRFAFPIESQLHPASPPSIFTYYKLETKIFWVHNFFNSSSSFIRFFVGLVCPYFHCLCVASIFIPSFS